MNTVLLTFALLAAALPSPPAWTQETSKETSKLAAFEPFIGTWAFTPEFTTANEWARDFHAEILDWGPRKNTVRMRETVRKDDPQRLVYEGFAYWHPTEDKLKYVGYNVQERFLFEGEIVALERNRMVTEYRVYYPPGYQHGAYGDVKGDVREYRGERKLLTPNTLEHKTFMKIEGRWVPWPAADAKPFVVERAGALAAAVLVRPCRTSSTLTQPWRR